MLIDVRLAAGTPRERRTRAQVLALLAAHDLAAWTFTDTVMIDESAYPHSHPVLTLDCSDQEPDRLLASYLHEQLHWFEEEHAVARDAAIEVLAALYGDVPAERPEGAGDRTSTLLHLIVCHLEHRSLQRVLGHPRATAVIEDLARHHYRWVYRTVLRDADTLAGVVCDHGLIPAGLAGGR